MTSGPTDIDRGEEGSGGRPRQGGDGLVVRLEVGDDGHLAAVVDVDDLDRARGHQRQGVVAGVVRQGPLGGGLRVVRVVEGHLVAHVRGVQVGGRGGEAHDARGDRGARDGDELGGDAVGGEEVGPGGGGHGEGGGDGEPAGAHGDDGGAEGGGGGEAELEELAHGDGVEAEDLVEELHDEGGLGGGGVVDLGRQLHLVHVAVQPQRVELHHVVGPRGARAVGGEHDQQRPAAAQGVGGRLAEGLGEEAQPADGVRLALRQHLARVVAVVHLPDLEAGGVRQQQVQAGGAGGEAVAALEAAPQQRLAAVVRRVGGGGQAAGPVAPQRAGQQLRRQGAGHGEVAVGGQVLALLHQQALRGGGGQARGGEGGGGERGVEGGGGGGGGRGGGRGRGRGRRRR